MDMQGILIKHLIDQIGTENKIKIAEIGVYMGRGTTIFVNELTESGMQFEYYGIDHFEGSAEHKNSGEIPEHEKAMKYLEPIKEYINIMKSDSINASTKFEDEYFDIVYIDASHEYEFVKKDIEVWLPKVKPGGFLCGDDYHPIWHEVIKCVDEKFGDTGGYVVGDTQWVYKK